jgi:hypothetical protein
MLTPKADPVTTPPAAGAVLKPTTQIEKAVP